MELNPRLCDICKKPLGSGARSNQKRHKECQIENDRILQRISKRKSRNRQKSEELLDTIKKDEDLMDKLATRVLDRINMNFEIYLGKPDEKGRQRGVMWRSKTMYPPKNDLTAQMQKEQEQNAHMQYIINKSMEDQRLKEERDRDKKVTEILEQQKVILSDNEKIKKKLKIRRS